MKAEMAADGVITLRPESEVEAYALRVWGDDYHNQQSQGVQSFQFVLRKSTLLVDAQ